ncbi:hypothetical protein HDU78_005083, partial [Chytriomyces hyalinus]
TGIYCTHHKVMTHSTEECQHKGPKAMGSECNTDSKKKTGNPKPTTTSKKAYGGPGTSDKTYQALEAKLIEVEAQLAKTEDMPIRVLQTKATGGVSNQVAFMFNACFSVIHFDKPSQPILQKPTKKSHMVNTLQIISNTPKVSLS